VLLSIPQFLILLLFQFHFEFLSLYIKLCYLFLKLDVTLSSNLFHILVKFFFYWFNCLIILFSTNFKHFADLVTKISLKCVFFSLKLFIKLTILFFQLFLQFLIFLTTFFTFIFQFLRLFITLLIQFYEHLLLIAYLIYSIFKVTYLIL
jgi:hypothetical protein